MNYRKVPFMYNPLQPARGLGAGQVLRYGGALPEDGMSWDGGMAGLGAGQVLAYGGALPEGGMSWEESGLGALDPTDFRASPRQRGRKVILRPKPGATIGWPGFFSWLSQWHPDFYNYLAVSLPNVAANTNIQAPAAQLGSLGDPASYVQGLGDTTINWLTTPADKIFSMAPPQAATDGVTNSAPQDTTSTGYSVINTIQSAVSSFLPLVTQQKLLNLQVDRAAKGLPPLDLSKYESSTQGLNVGINPATQQMLLILGGLAVAAFVVPKLLRR